MSPSFDILPLPPGRKEETVIKAEIEVSHQQRLKLSGHVNLPVLKAMMTVVAGVAALPWLTGATKRDTRLRGGLTW